MELSTNSMMDASNYTDRLRELMQAVNLSSFKALAQTAGVSEWQVQQLREGKADQMRVVVLLQLSRVLRVSLVELVEQFSAIDLPPQENHFSAENNVEQTNVEQTNVETTRIDALTLEYERLQERLITQRESLQQEFQQKSLQAIESLVLQLPTATYAAQQNPDIPASQLLPLLRPIDQLLQTWGIEAIATVGSEVEFDPQLHQLMEGTAEVGDRVRVRYTGYRQNEKLLYRAKVSPLGK